MMCAQKLVQTATSRFRILLVTGSFSAFVQGHCWLDVDKMDPPHDSSGVEDACNSLDKFSFEAYKEEILRQAELQCDVKIRQANIKKLTEDINVLAKEIKRELLTEKWGNTPQADGSQRMKSEHQAAKLCSEIAANPDSLDDVLMKLQYQKAALQSDVAQVMSELKEYEDVMPD